ncbi:hypothetical protein LXL04_032032 [Taraxacum kok-saghyz]
MAKSHTFITCLVILFLSSIAFVGSRPTTLSRRGELEYCGPLLGDCTDQWRPITPISSNNNPFISRPFLRRHRHRHTPPPLLLPKLPPVVMPSPPPISFPDPTFSPLVASPPPPGITIPPVFPELPPNDDDNLPPEVDLPPIVHRSQPDLYLSPPQLNLPPDLDVPAPPLVPIVSQQQEIVMSPPPPPTNK